MPMTVHADQLLLVDTMHRDFIQEEARLADESELVYPVAMLQAYVVERRKYQSFSNVGDVYHALHEQPCTALDWARRNPCPMLKVWGREEYIRVEHGRKYVFML